MVRVLAAGGGYRYGSTPIAAHAPSAAHPMPAPAKPMAMAVITAAWRICLAGGS